MSRSMHCRTISQAYGSMYSRISFLPKRPLNRRDTERPILNQVVSEKSGIQSDKEPNENSCRDNWALFLCRGDE